MNKRSTAASIAGIVAASLLVASPAAAVPDTPAAWEKCAGVAKAGKNDCGSTDGRHACAGEAEKDSDPTEWVYLPEGSCDKIVGGKVVGKKPAKAE